jgi:hypothetical protein
MKTWLTLLLCTCCATLAAAPAPWFWWESRLDGQRVCSQTPLGPGWRKADPRAYVDSRCTKLARAQ